MGRGHDTKSELRTVRQSTQRTQKPVLLLDVDGALCPLGKFPDSEFAVKERVGGLVVHIDRRNPARLSTLSENYEIVWATDWDPEGAAEIGKLHGISGINYLDVRYGASRGTRKLQPVIEFVGQRPFAWIDDRLGQDVARHFNSAGANFLLIRTKPEIGITDTHMRKLIRFSEALRKH